MLHRLQEGVFYYNYEQHCYWDSDWKVTDWKVFLRVNLCPGFMPLSSLNNSVDNRKLECDHKCKITNINVETKICRQKCPAVLQYLYLSDKNTLTKMRNIWIFEFEKFSLFDAAILLLRPLQNGIWRSHPITAALAIRLMIEIKTQLLKTPTVPAYWVRTTSISNHKKDRKPFWAICTYYKITKISPPRKYTHTHTNTPTPIQLSSNYPYGCIK